MAKNQDELRIKAVLDTSEFDSSLDGMKQEFAALEKKLGSSLLSDADQKAVLNRMGTLKKSIDGFNLQIDTLSKQSGFEQLVQATTPLIGGFLAASSALQLFGIENEKLNLIIQQTQALTIGLIALQDLSNLKQLKGLIALRVEKIKNFVIDKLTFKNTVQQTTANTAQAASQGKVTLATKIATKAQWLWNTAISANPILAIILAVAALAAGIYLLVKALGDSTEEYDKNNEAIDGTYITNEKLRESYNNTVYDLQKLNLEYQNIIGTLDDYTYQMQLLNLELDRNISLLDEERAAALAEAAEAGVSFWDQVVIGFAEYTNNYDLLSETIIESLESSAKEREEITIDYNKKIEALQLAHNNKVLKLQKSNNKKEIDEEKNQTAKILAELKKRRDDVFNQAQKVYQNALDLSPESLNKALKQIDFDFDVLTVSLENKRNELIDEIRENPVVAANFSTDDLKLFNDNAEEFYDNYVNIIIKGNDEASTAEREALKRKLQLNDLYNTQLIQEEIKKQVNIDKAKEEYRQREVVAEREHLENMLQLRIQYAQETQVVIERINDKFKGISFKSEYEYRKATEKQALGDSLNALSDYYKDKIKLATDSGDYEAAELLSLQMNTDMDVLEDTFNDRWEGFSSNVRDSIADMSGMIANAVVDVFTRDITNKFALLNETLANETDTALNSLDALRDADLISEEEYNQRQLKIQEDAAEKERILKVKQAKAEKRAALYQIVIDTAVAVAKSWGQGGGLLGAPIAAIAALAGALQLGLVASQPIPEYARGGKIGGNRHAFGGSMVEAEQGEFIVNRNSVNQPGVEALLSMINSNGNNNSDVVSNPSDGSTNANVIQQIVSDTIKGISSIPVTNLESEYSGVQRKVKSIESRSKW